MFSMGAMDFNGGEIRPATPTQTACLAEMTFAIVQLNSKRVASVGLCQLMRKARSQEIWPGHVSRPKSGALAS
jgi:hypothetical protein